MFSSINHNRNIFLYFLIIYNKEYSSIYRENRSLMFLASVGSLPCRSQATDLLWTVTSVKCLSTPCSSIIVLGKTQIHFTILSASSTSVSIAFEIIHRLEYKIPKAHSTIFLALNKPRFLTFCTYLSHFCDRESQVLENLFFFRRWNWTSLGPKTCLNRFVSRNPPYQQEWT